MGKPVEVMLRDRNRACRCGLRKPIPERARQSRGRHFPRPGTAAGRDGIGKECNGRTAGARQARNLCPFSERTGQLEAKAGCSSDGHRPQHEYGRQAGRACKGDVMSKERAVPHQFEGEQPRKRLCRAAGRAGAADRDPDPDRDGRDRPRDRLRPPAGRARLQRVRRRPVRQGIPRRIARRLLRRDDAPAQRPRRASPPSAPRARAGAGPRRSAGPSRSSSPAIASAANARSIWPAPAKNLPRLCQLPRPVRSARACRPRRSRPRLSPSMAGTTRWCRRRRWSRLARS